MVTMTSSHWSHGLYGLRDHNRAREKSPYGHHGGHRETQPIKGNSSKVSRLCMMEYQGSVMCDPMRLEPISHGQDSELRGIETNTGKALDQDGIEDEKTLG